jgi:hypothetical protein
LPLKVDVMYATLFVLALAVSQEVTSLEEKPSLITLPDDFPKEAVVCQDTLTTEEAICSKRLPIREALALVDKMTFEWDIGLSGQSYLTKPYIVTNFDPQFSVLAKQRPAF